MDSEKFVFPLRIDKTKQDMIKGLCKKANCFSQNEFIEKAIDYYISFLETNSYTDFLNPAIYNAIKAALKENENRTSANLFRLSVEMSIMMNLLAKGMDVPDEYVRRIRSRCVETVRNQKGKYTFEDAFHDANTFDGDEEY